MDRSELVMVRARPFNAETPPAALRNPVTATPLHYVRTNFDFPTHDGLIHLGGAVERPFTISVDELRARPATTLRVTLECAGNGRVRMAPLPTGEPWSGGAVATADWTGVPLAAILSEAAPTPDGVEVRFTGADQGQKDGNHAQFIRALPLDLARNAASDILLAYAMNGEPLNDDHGAPIRLIVPTWYGMASVKWLTNIDVLSTPYVGQFQTKSYVFEWPDGVREPVTRIRVNAVITDPASGDVVSIGPHTIHGKAWSGTGPVQAVEVNVDNSATWHAATITPSTDTYAWQDWSLDWNPAFSGRHVLRARAIDAAGNRQPDEPRWNRLGYGNNAIQVVVVDVR